MITFWIFAVVMVVIALFFLLRPLLQDFNKKNIDTPDRKALNVDITKERINELKSELEQSIISQAEYEQTREELEQSLLNDVEPSQNENAAQKNSQSYNRITRLVLIVTVPVFAISLYAFLGQPELLDQDKKQAMAKVPANHGATSGNGKSASIEEMIDKLARRLKEEPDNAKGWYMLGRSYMSLKKFKEAALAFEKANQLVPNTPVIMLQYADALTMLRGGQISGTPFELIKKAVEIKPDAPTGLWLLGMGYEEQGEYQKAISYWNLLLPLLKDEKSKDEVQNLIRQAKTKAGIGIAENSESVAIASEKKEIVSLKVRVSINKNQIKNVSMDDTVFIFAKAINGPPMPLAVARKKVKDLPIVVILDDTMAMVPSMKISSFTAVQITARISKSGQPRAQSGDVQSESRIVESSHKEIIKLTINKLLP